MLANFEKIKHYDLNNRAWFNASILKLKQEADAQHKTILNIQLYLHHSKGDIDKLRHNLGIRITRHPELPLMIFNYDHKETPHDSLIGIECRGLVLEIDTWNVVAKPMNRFFNWGEVDIENGENPNFDKSQFDFNNFQTQSKEDGSLMVLYNYKNTWMLNTRTSFLNMIGKKKVIMSGVHEVYPEEVIKVFLDAINPEIKKLEDMDQYLDKDHTYCFEFCSSINKIVRTYEKNTVFLLAVMKNTTLKEQDPEFVDKVALEIGACRPKVYDLKNFDQIVEAMKEMITKDPSLEGFVIRDQNASRWKIKSPSYFFLHHICYDHMRTPYPKDLVPLIMSGEGTELFSILEINGYKAELLEVQNQWKFCEKRLEEGYQTLKGEWEKIIKIESEKEFFDRLASSKTPLTGILEKLYRKGKSQLSDLEEEFNKDPQYLVENLFTFEEQYPLNSRKTELQICDIKEYKKDAKPFSHYSKKELNGEKWWKNIEEENDGITKKAPSYDNGQWNVQCYCGKPMKLFSVPENWYQYKCVRAPDCIYCKQSIVDKKRSQGKLHEKSNMSVLTYQCECGLAHRAHQHEKKITQELKRRPLKGKPLGLPCSHTCLALRHRVHEEIDKIVDLYKWNLDLVYIEASKILDVNTEFAHVGMLGISQCKKLIDAFIDMRGE